MTPKLYTFIESGNSYKVRLLASILHIDLEEVEVDYFNEQHHSEEFLEISPRGTLPVLVDGDKTFTDSAAILTYLAGTHSDQGSDKTPSSYWSADLVEQATIIDWFAFASSWVQFGVCKARGIVSFPEFQSDGTEQILVDAKIRGYKSLVILNKKLEKENWLALGRPTVADIAVFVYVALAPMGDISLEPYPAVKSWVARVKELPNFIAIDGLDDPFYRRKR